MVVIRTGGEKIDIDEAKIRKFMKTFAREAAVFGECFSLCGIQALSDMNFLVVSQCLN